MLYIGNFNYSDENDVSDNYVLMPAVVAVSYTHLTLPTNREV